MYNVEKVIRNFNNEEREIKFISGVGNLTSDITSREVQLKSGETTTVVGTFGQNIAFNYWENGEKKAEFFQLEAWGKTAELLARFGKKGTEMFVSGRLENRSSTNPKTGKTYTNEVLVVENFQVTSRGWEGQNLEGKKQTEPTEPVDVDGFEEVEEIPF